MCVDNIWAILCLRIFCDSVGWEITGFCLFFSFNCFVEVITIVFLAIKQMDSVLSLQQQGTGENLKLWRTKIDGIDQLSVRYQVWSVSRDSRVATFHYFVLCKGCCGTQYNLPERMLRHGLIQSWTKVIIFVSITYQSKGSISSIYPFLG